METWKLRQSAIENLAQVLSTNLRHEIRGKIFQVENPESFFTGEIAKKLERLLQELSAFKNHGKFLREFDVPQEIAKIEREIRQLIERV